MVGWMWSRVVGWMGSRCAGRRLRAGSRNRDQLLRRIGKTSGAARLPASVWRAHGEAAYRRFKWDPEDVAPEARVLCGRLMLLEEYLSQLVRGFGPAPGGGAAPRPPLAAVHAGGPRQGRRT